MERDHDHDHDHAPSQNPGESNGTSGTPAGVAAPRLNDAVAPASRHPVAQLPKNAGIRRFQSVEDLRGDVSIDAETRVYEIGKPPVLGDGSEVERRDFMKLLGATFAAASATAACGRLPVHHAVPYVDKPEEITPGKPVYYATTCGACSAGCGVLMKSRDGRPIKTEGNPDHPLSQGGVCAVGQASVLSLYDGDRLKGPHIAGKLVDWKTFDLEIDKSLAGFRADGSKLVLVSRTVSGPAGRAVVDQFVKAFPGARHVVLDPHGLHGVIAAHGATHGRAVVPGYAFDKADLVVALDCDFLGTWLQPVAFTKQWSPGRRLAGTKKAMSRLVVAEPHMTLTGSNADERLRVLPSELRAVALGLASRVAQAKGFAFPVPVPQVAPAIAASLDAWSQALVASSGRSLVVSGSPDLAVQTAVNLVNELLGNYGKTLDLDAHFTFESDQAGVTALLEALQAGNVQGLVLWDVNPAYGNPNAAKWAAGIQKVPFSVALNGRLDETAALCKLAAAVHHPLECWGDSEPVVGLVNVQQPLMRPLFDTRQAEEQLLAWTGKPYDMLNFVKTQWQTLVLPRAAADKPSDFQAYWDKAVHDGFVRVSRAQVAQGAVAFPAGPGAAAAPQPGVQLAQPGVQLAQIGGEANTAPVAEPNAPPALPIPLPAAPGDAGGIPATGAAAAAGLAVDASPTGLPGDATAVGLAEEPTAVAAAELVAPPVSSFSAAGVQQGLSAAIPTLGQGAYELVLYPKVGLGNGAQANNPFLHELPDPISKATWGNYACISPATAQKLGVGSSDVVTLRSGQVSVELPVVLTPGLHDGAVAVALGYGRKAVGRVGNGLGQDVSAFAGLAGIAKVDVQPAGKQDPVAFSQIHHSYEHRDCVRETTLPEWQANPRAGNAQLDPMLHDPSKKDPRITRSLWARHEYPVYKWGMSIDMNSCTGCGACVIACNVENNIPVVGKREVLVRREMHWLRIDRYFSEGKKVKGFDWDATEDDLLALSANPEVVHQPMLCQHCTNAPCETVCPVLATVHTSEGLNAQVYNRCIGTRYCANNCPYKVRRFNWFNYPTGDMVGKQDVDLVSLALNPDIVKRSRGVMEKCSFCVQRIQEAKSDAIRQGQDTPLLDGAVQTACQQTCPADAITFGNLNEAAAAVAQAYEDPRNYSALVEIGTQPAVTYMTKVRNTTPDKREG